MNTSASTTIIEKLTDLELISKLRADLKRYKRKREGNNSTTTQQAA